jgi:hypothetical protein
MDRIFYSDNGVLTDLSVRLSDYASGSYVFNSWAFADDALYIGSKAPFNSFYAKLGVVSTTSPNTMTVKYWDGDVWMDVVETIDETAGFTASGYVTFVPDKDELWQMESTNYDSDQITGLTSVKIYDRYWIKLTFSANFSATTRLDWMGRKFSDDTDLGYEFPDLVTTETKTGLGFANGYEAIHIKAAEMVVQDLIKKKVIFDKGQILDREVFKNASVQKVAELIFNMRGDDYIDQRNDARQEYQHRLETSIGLIDQNLNAIEDIKERVNRSGWLER